jgi:transcriptional regulator with XRE-family HTH domain
MAITEKVKILMLKRGARQKDVAEKLGMSAENFNNKLRRESFTVEELEKIANALGATYTRDEYFSLENGERI